MRLSPTGLGPLIFFHLLEWLLLSVHGAPTINSTDEGDTGPITWGHLPKYVWDEIFGEKRK